MILLEKNFLGKLYDLHVRLFIGIEIEPNKEIKGILNEIQLKGKKVKEENLHITLKFLGELNGYDSIVNSLETIKFEKFSLELKGLGAFPNERRARVLFIIADSNGKLESLAKLVDKATHEIKMDHPFTPHLTLMRFKFPADLGQLISKYRSQYFGKYDVNDFNLYSSELTPTGPIYKIIKKFQLI